jgi:hypothetical protein
MNMSPLFIRVVFLAIPGIIAAQVYRILTGGRKESLQYFIQILLFSILSYAFCDMGLFLLSRIGLFNPYASAFDPFFNGGNNLNGSVILSATVIGLVLALIASYVHTNKLINKLGSRFGATTRYGDQDVWTFLLNSSSVEWIYFRDHKYDLVYMGKVLVYSDTQEKRELLLEDVTVYSLSTSEELYSVEALYLSREDGDFTIEVPVIASEC